MKTSAQKEYTLFLIGVQRCIRYFRVGFLLHAAAGAGIILFLAAGRSALDYFKLCSFLECLMSGLLAFWGLSIVIFSQFDAFSRFQNYKQVKDLFHENGFDERIARLFTGSRCQRDSLMTAALDLDCAQELNEYLKARGYKWFHLIPDIFFDHPPAVFNRRFWKKTLFEKNYHSKYFLW